ncbi:MAG: chemotaxis protein CheW, partial [Thermodesulfobacteriota bacterium]|nr:chemotaxis protein CheW [Thermodesulfobacteriota bacterium]
MKEDKAVQIILFSLSGKSWGIKFEDIKEIIEVRQITPVPKTPPFISGIINHRGNILTIIDLALFAEQSPGNEKGYFKIFHLKSNKMNLGL